MAILGIEPIGVTTATLTHATRMHMDMNAFTWRDGYQTTIGDRCGFADEMMTAPPGAFNEESAIAQISSQELQKVMAVLAGCHSIKGVNQRHATSGQADGKFEFDAILDLTPGIDVQISMHLDESGVEKAARFSDASDWIGT